MLGKSSGAVLLLTAVLGAVGGAVQVPQTETQRPGASLAQLKGLVDAMQAGRVKVLLIHDVNPVYSLPEPLGFAEALDKVDLVVSFATLKDETSERADLVLPDHSPLESWGDAEPRAGVRSLLQPTIVRQTGSSPLLKVRRVPTGSRRG